MNEEQALDILIKKLLIAFHNVISSIRLIESDENTTESIDQELIVFFNLFTLLKSIQPYIEENKKNAKDLFKDLEGIRETYIKRYELTLVNLADIQKNNKKSTVSDV